MLKNKGDASNRPKVDETKRLLGFRCVLGLFARAHSPAATSGASAMEVLFYTSQRAHGPTAPARTSRRVGDGCAHGREVHAGAANPDVRSKPPRWRHPHAEPARVGILFAQQPCINQRMEI